MKPNLDDAPPELHDAIKAATASHDQSIERSLCVLHAGGMANLALAATMTPECAAEYAQAEAQMLRETTVCPMCGLVKADNAIAASSIAAQLNAIAASGR